MVKFKLDITNGPWNDIFLLDILKKIDGTLQKKLHTMEKWISTDEITRGKWVKKTMLAPVIAKNN